MRWRGSTKLCVAVVLALVACLSMPAGAATLRFEWVPIGVLAVSGTLTLDGPAPSGTFQPLSDYAISGSMSAPGNPTIDLSILEPEPTAMVYLPFLGDPMTSGSSSPSGGDPTGPFTVARSDMFNWIWEPKAPPEYSAVCWQVEADCAAMHRHGMWVLVVPEPSTALLLALGVLGLARRRGRSRTERC